MKRNIDFTNSDNKFEPIPAGHYVGYVFDIVDKPDRNGGSGVNVTFKVSEGDHAGRQAISYYSETPGGVWRIRELLEACGAQVPKRVVQVDYDRCLGKKVEFDISYPARSDGKSFAEVKNVVPYAEAEIATPDGDGAGDLPPF